LVTTSPLLGSTAARVDDSNAAPPLPDEDDVVVVWDAKDVLGTGTLTVGVVTVGVGTVGVVTVGVVTFGTGTGTLGGVGAFSLRGTSHFAFHAARAAPSLRESAFGRAMPGGDVPFEPEASEHSAVALKEVAAATAYGPPWFPNDALPEFLSGQRASAYCGCWKWVAAAVCPMGPVSAGLAVPSANGELSTAEWASE
jgi:hypothetical protein